MRVHGFNFGAAREQTVNAHQAKQVDLPDPGFISDEPDGPPIVPPTPQQQLLLNNFKQYFELAVKTTFISMSPKEIESLLAKSFMSLPEDIQNTFVEPPTSEPRLCLEEEIAYLREAKGTPIGEFHPNDRVA